jgi:hypothetical protein
LNPIVVHVVRPYSTEEEYLAAEAWSIEQRGMLLVDAEPLPADTALLFDVALADGHKPIRAEGRVVGSVPAQGDRPGGLRVRFKRFGAATKAFIERAVQAKSSPNATAPSSPIAAPELERPSMPELRASMTDLEAVSPPPPSPPPPSPPPPAVAPHKPSEREPSGIRQRVSGPVAAPANREELLARLRQRRQTG